MSELKTRFIDDTYVEYFNTGKHELAQIYLKSEADKVIAELNSKLDDLRYTVAVLRKDRSHQKYKRCLAMAQECEEAYNRECGLNHEEMTNKEFYRQQIEFWPRWRSKWLKIAEKFKQTLTAQYGKGKKNDDKIRKKETSNNRMYEVDGRQLRSRQGLLR